MPGRLIDGKSLAETARQRVAQRVRQIRERGGVVRLDAMLVSSGDNAARVYAVNQGRACEQLGIDYVLHELEAGASAEVIAATIQRLNDDADVHAMMLHMPLPDGVEPYQMKRLIDPDKDVEGVNPSNIGNVVYGRSMLAPCTAVASLKLLESTAVDLRGKR